MHVSNIGRRRRVLRSSREAEARKRKRQRARSGCTTRRRTSLVYIVIDREERRPNRRQRAHKVARLDDGRRWSTLS